MAEHRRISWLEVVFTFGAATVYFYLLLFTLLPYLKENLLINPAMYWFITGYFLFVPLFVYAILRVRGEGCRGMGQIMAGLNLKPFSTSDWKMAVGMTLLVFALTGTIFGGSILLNRFFGMPEIETSPWFMEMKPFEGAERLLLLVWLPMFFFNIVGEEILWRGYLQSRLQGRFAWLACSLLWLLFHIPFGIDLMILLLPVMVLLPYAFSRTRNTWVGVFIHGVYNGPMFVAVALGLMQ